MANPVNNTPNNSSSSAFSVPRPPRQPTIPERLSGLVTSVANLVNVSNCLTRAVSHLQREISDLQREVSGMSPRVQGVALSMIPRPSSPPMSVAAGSVASIDEPLPLPCGYTLSLLRQNESSSAAVAVSSTAVNPQPGSTPESLMQRLLELKEAGFTESPLPYLDALQLLIGKREFLRFVERGQHPMPLPSNPGSCLEALDRLYQNQQMIVTDPDKRDFLDAFFWWMLGIYLIKQKNQFLPFCRWYRLLNGRAKQNFENSREILERLPPTYQCGGVSCETLKTNILEAKEKVKEGGQITQEELLLCLQEARASGARGTFSRMMLFSSSQLPEDKVNLYRLAVSRLQDIKVKRDIQIPSNLLEKERKMLLQELLRLYMHATKMQSSLLIGPDRLFGQIGQKTFRGHFLEIHDQWIYYLLETHRSHQNMCSQSLALRGRLICWSVVELKMRACISEEREFLNWGAHFKKFIDSSFLSRIWQTRADYEECFSPTAQWARIHLMNTAATVSSSAPLQPGAASSASASGPGIMNGLSAPLFECPHSSTPAPATNRPAGDTVSTSSRKRAGETLPSDKVAHPKSS